MQRVARDKVVKQYADTLALILDDYGTFKVYLYNAAGKLPVANGKFRMVTAKAKDTDDALKKILPALDRSFSQTGLVIMLTFTSGLQNLIIFFGVGKYKCN